MAAAIQGSLRANDVEASIRNTVLMGAVYPLNLIFALCFMCYGFVNTLAPTFATIIPIEQWMGTPATTYAAASFVVTWSVPILIVFGLVLAFVAVSMPRRTSPIRTRLDRIPPYSIYKISQGASFIVTLRGFIAASVPIPMALRNIQTVSSPYLRHRVGAILAKLHMGRNLGEAMEESGHRFPDQDIVGEITIYVDLDEFDKRLDSLATEWIDDSIDRAKAISKVVSSVMMVFVAISLGSIAWSIFDLQQQIQQFAAQ